MVNYALPHFEEFESGSFVRSVASRPHSEGAWRKQRKDHRVKTGAQYLHVLYIILSQSEPSTLTTPHGESGAPGFIQDALSKMPIRS